MSDPVLPPPGHEAPIDAEFEPAPKRETKSTVKSKSGPGWFSFLLLGGVSLGALALSALSSDFLSPKAPNEALAADIERLKVDTETATEDRAALRQSFATISDEIDTDLASVTAKLTELEEALTLLEGDILSTEILSEDTGEAAGERVNITPLLARIEGLEAMVASLPQTTESAQDTAPFIASTDLTDIQDELADLRAETDRFRDELTTLRGDVSALIEANKQAAETDQSAETSASAAVALSSIEAAARRGQPFQMAYQTLAETDPDLRGLEALRPIAATGAKTLPDLRDDFLPLKREALKRDADSKGGTASVLQSLFGDGIKVRRAGEIDTASVLETAQTALVTGDLDAALGALETLPEDIQSVFTDWRDNAQNRLTLEDSLDTLRLAMIAKDRP